MATMTGKEAEALSNQKVPRGIEKHVLSYFKQVREGK
jgi:hypothetical protein